MSTVKKDDRVEAALKANYKTKKYGVTTSIGSTGLVRMPFSAACGAHPHPSRIREMLLMAPCLALPVPPFSLHSLCML